MKEPIINLDENLTFHDLDFFAGTWSEDDAAEFEKATEYLRQVDEDLWRE
ncbi:MAG TPA: hypothetical protein VGG20_08880 [Thermoanaerobaculia bacterium]|jgi:hypothetical protein